LQNLQTADRRSIDPSGTEARSRVWRGPARAAGAAVLLLVTVEAGLQLLSLTMSDKSGAGWRPGARVRVLAVGDSHTYGGTVGPEETYPARLEKALDDARPGYYSVLNVGIPGLNTSQLRNRLPLSLSRWDPDIVVIWCGANNAWNAAEMRPEGWLRVLDVYGLRLRTYKLVRVMLNDRALNLETERRISEQRHRITTLDRRTQVDPFLGEVKAHERPAEKVDREAFEQARDDFRSIVEMIRASGATPIFITYPLEFERFVVANRAARDVGQAMGIPVVEGGQGHFRVPGEENRYTWALHPSAPVYGEIAKDVARAILTSDASPSSPERSAHGAR
jgi:lysophospholipase L1-like esterase